MRSALSTHLLKRGNVNLRHSTTNDKVIEKLKNKVNELEIAQKKKIAEVLKIRRLKEGLDKLRTKAKMQFMKEQERLEQAESDEMNAVVFSRKIMQQTKS